MNKLQYVCGNNKIKLSNFNALMDIYNKNKTKHEKYMCIHLFKNKNIQLHLMYKCLDDFKNNNQEFYYEILNLCRNERITYDIQEFLFSLNETNFNNDLIFNKSVDKFLKLKLIYNINPQRGHFSLHKDLF